jgi:replicative DNA helicase
MSAPELEATPDARATVNPEAETALLCAVLSGHPAAAETLSLVAGRDFYQPRNEAVWRACQEVAGRGDRIDVRTLPVPAKARPYVLDLFTAQSEPLHAAQYAALVVDAAQRRRIVEASVAIRQRAEVAENAAEAAQDARQIVDRATEAVTDADSGIGAAELVQQTIDGLQDDDVSKVLTGWSELDHATDGMRPGQLIVIGARPGFGKSVVAANIAASVCKDGLGVHFASLEMPRREVMNRLLANHCGVNLSRLMDPSQMVDDDWERLSKRAGRERPELHPGGDEQGSGAGLHQLERRFQPVPVAAVAQVADLQPAARPRLLVTLQRHRAHARPVTRRAPDQPRLPHVPARHEAAAVAAVAPDPA